MISVLAAGGSAEGEVEDAAAELLALSARKAAWLLSVTLLVMLPPTKMPAAGCRWRPSPSRQTLLRRAHLTPPDTLLAMLLAMLPRHLLRNQAR